MSERESRPSGDGRAPDALASVPTVSRRAVVRSAGVLAGAAAATPLLRALGQARSQGSGSMPAAGTPAVPTVTADPSTVPGLPSEALGARSPFEHPALAPTGVTTGSTFTPLQSLSGTITPSDLHFQRNHNGIAIIDPERYELTVHGLVDRPVRFTLAALRRFPSVTRVAFVECAGNGRSAYRSPRPDMTPQIVDGLTSNSEWTGVPVATLLHEAGMQPRGTWVLAEGGDASRMSRSIPMAKMMDDALVVYAQNGEPLRAGNGYPVRLLLPGYEGNANIKWLRRLEVIAEPNMSRDETAKYTDPLPGGRARQFSFVMDVKSLITSPAAPERLAGAGWWPIRGLAWSGRGRIRRVEVSTDGGRRWTDAALVGDVQPMAHTRFELPWRWDGTAALLMSRATDETGAIQPTLEEFRRVRGAGTDYHYNAIRTWRLDASGAVTFEN